MRGQRIIDRLTSGEAAIGNKGLTKRELKKRVSVKYRKEAFESDYEFLTQSNVITQQRIGRELRTVVTCPGVHNDGLDIEAVAESRVESQPAATAEIKVGDRVMINFKVGSGWNGPGTVVEISFSLYSVRKDAETVKDPYYLQIGSFNRNELTLLAQPVVEAETTGYGPNGQCDSDCPYCEEDRLSLSESLQAELEPIPAPKPRSTSGCGGYSY